MIVDHYCSLPVLLVMALSMMADQAATKTDAEIKQLLIKESINMVRSAR